MIVYQIGSLFDSTQLTIGHGVNCLGFMGAGIALQFRQRFPSNFYMYKTLCDNGNLKPGDAMFVDDVDDKTLQVRKIANLATQYYPGDDATIPRVENAIEAAVMHLTDLGIYEMAIPKIGCGIGGLEWKDVEEVLSKHDKFVFEVWEYIPVVDYVSLMKQRIYN
jgi:O-acetyl-ADP-ribose deacetylase (regulator of RNase III)